MTRLERHCRLLLRAYPVAYRRDRGEEIIGTLLEATPAERSWPLARDVRGLAVGALRVRAALNRRQTTAANLGVAAFVGATAYLAFSAVFVAKFAVSTLTVPALMGHLDGWHLLSVAALAGAAATLAWVGSRRTVVLVAVLAAALGVALSGQWFFWQIPEFACLAALALLGGRKERPGRGWLWLVALIGLLPLLTGLAPGFWTFPSAAWLIGLGAVGLLWCVIDARPLIATAVFLVAFTLPSAIEDAGPPPGVQLILILSAVAVIAVVPLHRQSFPRRPASR